MINIKVKEQIETVWPKPQQRDFYQLVCQKRQQIRTLIQNIRNQH